VSSSLSIHQYCLEVFWALQPKPCTNCLFKNCKIEVKNEFDILFFPIDAMTACKQDAL